MGYRSARILTVVLVAAALILPPPSVEACGPDFSGPTFVNYNMPDAPLEAYSRGKLGLINMATTASICMWRTAISSASH